MQLPKIQPRASPVTYMTRPVVESEGREILGMLSAAGCLTLTMYGMSKKQDQKIYSIHKI